MFPFRRSFLTLAFAASAFFVSQSPALIAQASSSAQPDAPAAAQAPAQAPAAGQGQLTVAARIKARREQRRAAAIKEVYSHLYDLNIGMGYTRFTPGKTLQRVNEYSWDTGLTRYFNERLGVAVDARGTYGSAFIGPNQYSNSAIYKPAISQYLGMIGPTYRFLLNPKYSISGKIMGGGGYGNFSGDTGSFNPTGLGLYKDGPSAAISASVPIEYNVSPELGLRVSPEYVFTTFGSTTQNSLGYTIGVIVRWGKQ
jgi:hypothetical protein